MSGWPAVHTPQSATARVAWWMHLVAVVVSAIGCTLIGVAAMFAGAGLGQTSELGGPIYFVGLILAYAFFYSWLGFLPGVPMAMLALRKKRAGWAVALAAGAASGGLAGLLMGIVLPAALVGMLMAGLYWLALRVLAPATFGLPAEKGKSGIYH